MHQQRFNQQPEIYKQFLEILQTYQRESKPIQDVYAQVTQLFSSAPDLLEDFKQFLPESAAQAKAQAAAARQQQATEEVAMISNVRNDPYVAVAQHNQSQTPRNELKMPPVGNFAPPQSASKENKKRRGGAGSQTTGGATAPEVPSLTVGHSIKNGNLRGNASKVSEIYLELLKSCQEPDILFRQSLFRHLSECFEPSSHFQVIFSTYFYYIPITETVFGRIR